MLGFGQVQEQDAFAGRGLGTLRIDRRGQRECLREMAAGETLPERGGALGRAGLRLPLQSDRILLRSDLYILCLHSRHRNLQDEAFWRLEQVGAEAATAQLP